MNCISRFAMPIFAFTVFSATATQSAVYAEDSADPSHFTIRYEMWGKSDVLDGRLNDDDSVTLEPRHPPAED